MIVETVCQSIVNRSRLPAINLCANPYAGCGHRCAYCYTQWVRFGASAHAAVRAKVNAAEVLRRQLPRLRGTVVLSTMTDPYQPAEARYRLTRSLLEMLLESALGVSVLTKSDLCCRDLALLARFPRVRCEVGLSVAPLSAAARRELEPGAPTLERRIAALGALRHAGVRTFAFVAPILPGVAPAEVDRLVALLDGVVDRVLVDELRGPHRELAPLVARLGGSGASAEELGARVFEQCAGRGLPARSCQAAGPG